MKKALVTFILTQLVLSFSVSAATVQRNTYIYRYPFKNSQKVDRVYRNQKASIKGSTGAFYKVKTFSKRYNRSIEGWIAKQAFVAVKKKVTPTPKKARSYRKPTRPPQRRNYYKKKTLPKQSSPTLHFALGPSYSALNYLIRSENNNPFYNYWTGGPGITGSMRYNITKTNSNTPHFYYFELSGSFHRFSANANLQDTSGTTFLQRTITQNMFQIHPTLHYMNQSSNNMNWGINLGYQIQNLNSNDIQNASQVSQNVFNSFSSKQITLGLSLRKIIASMPLGASLQYAFGGSYSDKSQNNVLGNTSLKLGLIGQLYYDYILNTKHKIRLYYALDYKHYSNTGSFDLGNESYTNSQFEYLQHKASLEYRLSF